MGRQAVKPVTVMDHGEFGRHRGDKEINHVADLVFPCYRTVVENYFHFSLFGLQ